MPRNFTCWREPEVRAALRRADWADASIDHVASGGGWLHVMAGAETGGVSP